MKHSTCSIEGCERPYRAKGYCSMHWFRNNRDGSPGPAGSLKAIGDESLSERLERRGWTVTPSGCWEWNGAKYASGYGHIGYRGENTYTHRLSYELHVGPIPDGMFVCHRCDNRSCMNPAHLFLGTPRDNASDMHQKRRHAHGAKMGSAKLTESDVWQIRALLETGMGQAAIGRQFGVTQSCVYGIASGRTWAHLTRMSALLLESPVKVSQ